MGHTDVPTPYAGLVFRSRHEANWAAFFDACDWRWEYQPWDNTEVAPTFLLWFEDPLFVLVRAEASEGYLLRLAEIVSRYGRESPHGILYPNVLLLDLSPPMDNRKLGGSKIGLVGYRETGWPRFDRSSAECLGDANLVRCPDCQGLTIVSVSGLMYCLRCGSRGRNGLLLPVAWTKGRALWHRAKERISEASRGA